MKFNILNRRMFLQGLGGALMPIPFLQSLLPKVAWGGPGDLPIKRYLGITSSYDYGHHAAWFPTGENNLTNVAQPTGSFSPGNGQAPVFFQELRQMVPGNADQFSRVFGNHLSPYVDQMNIIRGLDFLMRYGHGQSQLFGGVKGDLAGIQSVVTIDQVLANNLQFNPNKLKAIVCGRQPWGGAEAWSYSPSAGGGATPSAGTGSYLGEIYGALFNDGNYPENGQPSVPHPRYDILSKILSDYNRVQNSRNISSLDKATLSDAADKISDTQKSLRQVATEACRHKSLAANGSVGDITTDATRGKALADMITAAFMCDVSRVMTVNFDMLERFFDGSGYEHSQSHFPLNDYAGKKSWVRMADRQSELVKNFLKPLVENLSSAIDVENNRSILYNSIIHYTMESAQAHSFASNPCVLIGNAAGGLSSGHYIDYSNRSLGSFVANDSLNGTPGSANFGNDWVGVQYNRVLVTVLQAFGLTPADYEDASLSSVVKSKTNLGPLNTNVTNIGGFGHAIRFNYESMPAYARTGFDQRVINYNLNHFKLPLAMPASKVT